MLLLTFKKADTYRGSLALINLLFSDTDEGLMMKKALSRMQNKKNSNLTMCERYTFTAASLCIKEKSNININLSYETDPSVQDPAV